MFQILAQHERLTATLKEVEFTESSDEELRFAAGSGEEAIELLPNEAVIDVDGHPLCLSGPPTATEETLNTLLEQIAEVYGVPTGNITVTSHSFPEAGLTELSTPPVTQSQTLADVDTNFYSPAHVELIDNGPTPVQQAFFNGTLEDEARRIWTEREQESSMNWVMSGAGNNSTVVNNRRALEEWGISAQLVDKYSCDRTDITIGIDFLDLRSDYFVGLAPIGVGSASHPRGELVMASAAGELNMLYCLSTVSSYPIEAVAQRYNQFHPGKNLVFQLYHGKSRDVSSSLIKRAAQAGAKAIMLTIDCDRFPFRYDVKHSPFGKARGMSNFVTDPVFRKQLPRDYTEFDVAKTFLENFSDPNHNWDEVAWVVEEAASHNLPVIVKGVQSVTEAKAALAAGAKAVSYTNHGGRQVPGAVGAFREFREVCEEIKSESAETPVLFDSGIRSSEDLYRVAAHQADAAMIGRLYMCAARIDGQAGVVSLVKTLQSELIDIMYNTGCSKRSDITPDRIIRL